jgi:hypothetical protein
VQVIGEFLHRRSDQILSNGPDGGRQIDRLNQAPGGVSGTTSVIGFTGFEGRSAVGLGEGPDAGDISRMRLGLYSRPLASAFGPAEPSTATPGPGGPASEAMAAGGASVGPLGFTGSTDGVERFGFSTSLRDVARFAAQEEARKASDSGLGFASRPGTASPAIFNPFDVWVDVKFTSFSDGRKNTNLDGHFGLASIGADYVVNRSVLIGTLVQFDSASERSDSQASAVSGWGWMVGPYSTVRLTDNLFWQARAAWGKSSNDVSPFLTYTDQFDTTRWLASSVLTGRWRAGPWEFTPSASVAYMVDAANSYLDTFGVVVPEVKSRLGQAKAGPEVGYFYTLDGVKMEPHAGFQLIWNFATDTTANGIGSLNGESAGPPGVRGRLDLGVRATRPDGVGIDVSGSYDGVGSRGYDAVTGKVLLRMPLN